MEDVKAAAERHEEFKAQASQAGTAFEGSRFEPGIKAAESGKDYMSTAADDLKGAFEGKGYSDAQAEDFDKKFEEHVENIGEAKAHLEVAGADPDQSPDGLKDEREDKDG